MFKLLDAGAGSWVITSFKLQKVISYNFMKAQVRSFCETTTQCLLGVSGFLSSHVVEAGTVVCMPLCSDTDP